MSAMLTNQSNNPDPKITAARSPVEEAVKALHASLTETQKREICFPWDYQDEQRGQLRTFVSNHWYVTRPFIRSDFFTPRQQAVIHDIFTALINPEWYGRFLKQIKDDTYGQDLGEEQSIAIFGRPGSGSLQFVLTGRHMTLRADCGRAGPMAFGGPILYGHATGGYYTEKPHHPGNVFWYQAEMANKVFHLLDSEQRRQALVDRLPPEAEVEFRQPGLPFQGIPVAGLDSAQKTELRKVLQALIDPFCKEDQTRVLACLQKQGGLDLCHLAFYREGQLSSDGPLDNWRLEGPAFVWYFRGAPHVHVWVNVGDSPSVPLNARVRFVAEPFPKPRSSCSQLAAQKAPGRNVVAISTVKNEIDIVEAFVRHTLAFVDHLVIADNGSTDGTLDILRALEREGLPLTVTEDRSAGKYLSQRMTRLMREEAAKRHGADWIVPLDADEFLVVPERTTLIPENAAVDATIDLPWRTYVPDESDEPAKLNPVLRIRHRLVREGWPFVKVLVPRQLAMHPDAVLTQGSHLLHLSGQPCPTVAAQKAVLAHFPIRGPGQYLAKIAISALQYHTMGTQAAGLAFHWRAPYALLKRDPEAFAASIFADARRFSVPAEVTFQPATVLDPLRYRGGPLLHTAMIDDRTRGWQAVLAYAEQLARRYAAMTASLTPQERVTLEQQVNALMNPGCEAYPTGPLLLKTGLELRQELEALQRELAGCRHQNARFEADLAQSRVETARHQAELHALRRSWTWNVGAVFVRPASRTLGWLKRVGRRFPTRLGLPMLRRPR
jgi:hypothetical protein